MLEKEGSFLHLFTHVFGKIMFTYLCVTSTCSQYIVAVISKLDWSQRQGIKLPLETTALYSDSFVAQKLNVEQKVAEKWAWPRTGPHIVSSRERICLQQKQNIL